MLIIDGDEWESEEKYNKYMENKTKMRDRLQGRIVDDDETYKRKPKGFKINSYASRPRTYVEKFTCGACHKSFKGATSTGIPKDNDMVKGCFDCFMKYLDNPRGFWKSTL